MKKLETIYDRFYFRRGFCCYRSLRFLLDPLFSPGLGLGLSRHLTWEWNAISVPSLFRNYWLDLILNCIRTTKIELHYLPLRSRTTIHSSWECRELFVGMSSIYLDQIRTVFLLAMKKGKIRKLTFPSRISPYDLKSMSVMLDYLSFLWHKLLKPKVLHLGRLLLYLGWLWEMVGVQVVYPFSKTPSFSWQVWQFTHALVIVGHSMLLDLKVRSSTLSSAHVKRRMRT